METDFLTRRKSIAPLAVFRIVFGATLFASTLRFIAKGWIYDFYAQPKYHFPFLGFEWLSPLPESGMYVLHGVMAAAALFICLGFYYRAAAISFFVCFCYTELLDKTYYLNHYYLVSILSFLLILVPAHRNYSLDVVRKPSLRADEVPAWTILIFKYQLFLVYFFAGLSKLTHDWLFEAMPLKIWLRAKTDVPFIGQLFRFQWAAYLFSWCGALFDLCVPFLLFNRKTRLAAYLLVVIFHTLTALLFQIGMFPYFMIAAALIFFSGNFHLALIQKVKRTPQPGDIRIWTAAPHKQKLLFAMLMIFFFLQVAVPLRFLLYPGKLLWTEEGYRFSWRVMLMEKSGTAFFYVKDPETGRRFEVRNSDFLTPYQERMMETQPDMMLQYAHILKHYYQAKGIPHPKVTAESYVSLNGKGSRLYIDSSVNLAEEREKLFGHKQWILPPTGN